MRIDLCPPPREPLLSVFSATLPREELLHFFRSLITHRSPANALAVVRPWTLPFQLNFELPIRPQSVRLPTHLVVSMGSSWALCFFKPPDSYACWRPTLSMILKTIRSDCRIQPRWKLATGMKRRKNKPSEQAFSARLWSNYRGYFPNSGFGFPASAEASAGAGE